MCNKAQAAQSEMNHVLHLDGPGSPSSSPSSSTSTAFGMTQILANDLFIPLVNSLAQSTGRKSIVNSMEALKKVMARVKQVGETNPQALEFSDMAKFEADKDFAQFLFRETGFKSLNDYFNMLREEEDAIEHPGVEQTKYTGLYAK